MEVFKNRQGDNCPYKQLTNMNEIIVIGSWVCKDSCKYNIYCDGDGVFVKCGYIKTIPPKEIFPAIL